MPTARMFVDKPRNYASRIEHRDPRSNVTITVLSPIKAMAVCPTNSDGFVDYSERRGNLGGRAGNYDIGWIVNVFSPPNGQSIFFGYTCI